MNDITHIDRSFEFTVSTDPELKHIGIIEIHLTYCNFVRELVHAETDAKRAGEWFAQELTEALLPSSSSSVHIRMIHLVVRDTEGKPICLSNTGPFACQHMSTGQELDG